MQDRPLTAADPRAEYTARLDARQAALRRAVRNDDLLGNTRAVVFLLGLATAVGIVRWEAIHGGWAVATAVPFLVALGLHWRCQALRQRLARSVAHYQRAIRRLDERWRGEGESGTRYLSTEHLYADDLDLFGDGSLFELICTARTRMGEDTLAAWLMEPADREEVLRRQEAVEELRVRLDLRQRLAILPQEVHEKLDADEFRAWITRQPGLEGRAILAAAIGLPVLMAVALGFWFTGTVSFGVPGLVFLLQMGGWLLLRKRINAVVRIAEGMTGHLTLLSRVLAILQQESFQCEKLAGLKRRLESARHDPAVEISRLSRLIDAHDRATLNQFAVPFAIASMLPLWIGLAMERWRKTVGRQAVDWLAVVGELEALSSLAGYAFERPDDVFPTVSQEGPLLAARQLGHPLLPRATCRTNDVRLDGSRQMILISGSNMSGKSTMLRTVGINVVLALAGAPVRAERFEVSELAIGTSINIRDSLQEGRSHFYAEMARLKSLVELTDGDRPLLFLMDEIMHGTNSHDRRIGTQAVVGKLLEAGAIGLITTHDLALAKIVDSLNGQAENAHFQDELVDGKMTFDYRMRPGVVQKSNALDVMRSLGLDV